ncbi:MAG: hypothetical protein MUE90_08945, partial [Thermoanaerobaculales bacterium]|nr:hypothetical protein [Thermoanaerobaculales bacterium]
MATADPGAPAAHPPSRAEYEGAPRSFLTRGAPFKADVVAVDLDGRALVVKDFAARAWWRRLIGRLEVDRECRAYRYLGPALWLPRFAGRIDAHALAVERIAGVELARSPERGARREHFLNQIRAALEHLAERGFLHLDARNNKNLLVRPDGTVVLIDLAGSFWIPPRRPGHRTLRRLAALYHEATLIKWEALLRPEGDPRVGQPKPPRYVNGLIDL